MVDPDKEYTSADVLTLDDALSLAVLGYKVHAVDMQPGSFIDYNFAGFRINFDSGASSGWRQRINDENVEWRVIDDVHVNAYKAAVAESFDEPVEPEPSKWGKPSPGLHVQQVGRALRPAPVPSPGFSVDAGARVWGLNDRNPAEVARSVAVDAAASAGLGVDHASFDRAAAALNEPVAAPSVGKWGKPPVVVPSKDKWGR